MGSEGVETFVGVGGSTDSVLGLQSEPWGECSKVTRRVPVHVCADEREPKERWGTDGRVEKGPRRTEGFEYTPN